MTAPNQPNQNDRRDAYRVGPGMHVQLEYRVRDADGELVGPDDERLSVIFGTGQLLEAVERCIDGLGSGDTRQVKLSARDAYGPRNPEAILEVDRSEFPDDVSPGDYFEVENAEKGILVLRVLEMGEDFVLVDLNHPLAGQELDVEVAVRDVRPATKQELDSALLSGETEAPAENTPLISPDRLLRGGPRR